MKKANFLMAVIAFIISFHSCKKDDKGSPEDETLYGEVTSASKNYYQNANTLAAAGNSPHGSFKLWFNATAKAALDTTGELPSGSSFPSGSLIVKEVQSGGATSLYAVMKKDPASANAGSGWLWAEYNTDGSVVISVTKKGSDGSCVSCHSGNTNRDLTNTFDLH